MAHNLYASRPDLDTLDNQDGAQRTQTLLKLLDVAFGIRTIGWIDEQETVIVTDSHNYWWTLFDNGGEIQVERVNTRPDSQEWFAVPTDCSMWENPNPGTTAYRISRIIKGERIEWDWVFTEEDQRIVLGE